MNQLAHPHHVEAVHLVHQEAVLPGLVEVGPQVHPVQAARRGHQEAGHQSAVVPLEEVLQPVAQAVHQREVVLQAAVHLNAVAHQAEVQAALQRGVVLQPVAQVAHQREVVLQAVARAALQREVALQAVRQRVDHQVRNVGVLLALSVVLQGESRISLN